MQAEDPEQGEELEPRVELEKYLRGEESDFSVVFEGQSQETIGQGYQLYGDGFLYVCLAGLIFIVGWAAMMRVRSLFGG